MVSLLLSSVGNVYLLGGCNPCGLLYLLFDTVLKHWSARSLRPAGLHHPKCRPQQFQTAESQGPLPAFRSPRRLQVLWWWRQLGLVRPMGQARQVSLMTEKLLRVCLRNHKGC